MEHHPQNQSATRANLARAMAKGGEHIGDLVWFEVALGDARFRRSDICSMLDAEHLPIEWAPPEPSGQKAFGKALGACRNIEAAPGISIERESLRSRTALVRHSSGRGLEKSTTTWARVEVDDLDEIEIEWSAAPECRAAINGLVGSVTYEHALKAVSVLQAEYARRMDYVDAPELGEMMSRVVDKHLNGTRIRRNGGLYFVDTRTADELRGFSRVVSHIAGCVLHFMPAHDTPEGRKELGASVSAQLHEEVREVLAGLRDLGTESRKPKPSSLRRRLDMLDVLSGRAEAARIILADYSDDISRAVAGARKEVTAMMEIDDLDEVES